MADSSGCNSANRGFDLATPTNKGMIVSASQAISVKRKYNPGLGEPATIRTHSTLMQPLIVSRNEMSFISVLLDIGR
jgi:hypothetical protein